MVGVGNVSTIMVLMPSDQVLHHVNDVKSMSNNASELCSNASAIYTTAPEDVQAIVINTQVESEKLKHAVKLVLERLTTKEEMFDRSLKRVLDLQEALEKANTPRTYTQMLSDAAHYVSQKVSTAWNSVSPYLGDTIVLTVALSTTLYCGSLAALSAYAYRQHKKDFEMPNEKDENGALAEALVYTEADYHLWYNRMYAAGAISLVSGIACLTKPVGS